MHQWSNSNDWGIWASQPHLVAVTPRGSASLPLLSPLLLGVVSLSPSPCKAVFLDPSSFHLPLRPQTGLLPDPCSCSHRTVTCDYADGQPFYMQTPSFIGRVLELEEQGVSEKCEAPLCLEYFLSPA